MSHVIYDYYTNLYNPLIQFLTPSNYWISYLLYTQFLIYYWKSQSSDITTIEEREKIAELHKFIDKLPSKQKIALTLFVYDELPQKEIAEIMGVSVNSVEVLVFRAKQNIKKLIYNNIYLVILMQILL